MNRIENLELIKENLEMEYDGYVAELVDCYNNGNDKKMRELNVLIRDIQKRIFDIDLALATQKKLQNNENIQLVK